MTPDALVAALSALERSREANDSTPHGSSAAAFGGTQFTTPAIPMKWRRGELGLHDDNVPLNLGVEKIADDDEARWSALGFKLPRRMGDARRHSHQHHDRITPRRDGVEVDWDCGICLQPASNPCVTRCGHLFCEQDLGTWFRSKATTEFQCPVCSAACIPDRDVVPIFGRGRRPSDPESPTRPRPTHGLRLRRSRRRSSSEEMMSAGLHETGESDASVDLPSLTSSSLPSERGSPTPSGAVTPAVHDSHERDESGANVVGLLYPRAHPLLRDAVISKELGRLLSLLGFVALMIFLSK
ncbi:hypothetical protein BKA62DRAFT_718995 [Auriculariales sp. MPI-PUGE-AT-0066]|nr:hypothetical protein BKA62DRAFT_718995 [Auriculariales sp. MPI-PUGE-AT-0066]